MLAVGLLHTIVRKEDIHRDASVLNDLVAVVALNHLVKLGAILAFLSKAQVLVHPVRLTAKAV